MNSHFLRRVFLTCVVLACGATQAQIPEPLRFQGYLADNAGQALEDPTTVTFALYTAPVGGSALWTDTQLVVPDAGLFSTDLGSVGNPFPAGLFDTPLWLGVTVGSDAEMTPRRALRSAAYAKKASDAQTLGGLGPTALDQSDEVDSLQNQVGSLSSDISGVSDSVSAIQQQVNGIASDVGSNASDLQDATAELTQLGSEVATATSDINSLEATVSNKQDRVNGSCAAGQAIRAIASSGSVTCEVDNPGQWTVSGANAFLTSAERIGMGTSAPAAMIQIDSPVDLDPFRARVGSATKLRVHQNGSVSVGTSSMGPQDGLHIAGDVGIGTATPAARQTIRDTNWQLSLSNSDVGGSEWFVGSSATAWSAGGGKLIFAPTDNSGASVMTLAPNGNVGIDNNDPQGRLQISGGTDVTPSTGGFAIFGASSGSQIAIDNNEIMARNATGSATLALNAEGGTVTVNSGGQSNDPTALEVTGEAIFDSGENSTLIIGRTSSTPTNQVVFPSLFEEGLLGMVSRPFWRTYSREFYAESPLQYKTYSDASLKRDVKTIDNAVATIMQLDGVTYALDAHPFDNRTRSRSDKEIFDRENQLGFIAQDLEKVLPQLVSEDPDSGLKTVGYIGVLPILVEAIKEQQRRIDQQDARIAELEQRLK